MAELAAKGTRPRLTRIYFAALVGLLLTAGTGWLLQAFRLGSGLKQKSYDLLHIMRGELKTDEAVVVYLDDQSHTELKQPRNAAWSRQLHARLIDRLTHGGARAIVFDIVFSDPDPAADGVLAAAMKRHGKVVLAADRRVDASGGIRFDRACDELLDSAADFGSVERVPDPDLVVRRHTPRHPDEQVGILSWVTAQVVESSVTRIPDAELQPRWMNYYGRPNVIPHMSYHEVLIAGEDVDLGVSNKVVFVGAKILTKFAGERKDEFPSPFSSFETKPVFMAGVENQATEFLNLERGDWLRRWPLPVEKWLIIAFGVLLGGWLVFLTPMRAVAATALVLATVVIVAYFLFTRKLTWFPWLILIAQGGVALSWSVLFNSVQLYVQKRLFEHTLGLYLSPKLVAKFASSPDLLKPGAEKQQLTLLFSDIADFTRITERMDPDELAAMMNEYFQGAVGSCIHRTDGTVVKYIGDAIFGLWNAPDPQVDHAARACEAALHFRELSKIPVRGRLLHTRIGLHTGTAKVGNFGSEDRFDYTAFGENVNMASRMEGLNKHLGTDCLISGVTAAEVAGRFVIRRLGQFQLKGFEGLVEVHELLGFPDQAEATRRWREAFAEALNNFEQRNLAFAEMGFRQVLELKLEDGPSKFYLERIRELGEQELPELWATHTIVKEK
jgi:adenylate cyclase